MFHFLLGNKQKNWNFAEIPLQVKLRLQNTTSVVWNNTYENDVCTAPFRCNDEKITQIQAMSHLEFTT